VPDAPLVLGPLYGLRTWKVVEGERLAGPYSGTVWPTGGAWLEARCGRKLGHRSPARGCACGVYGWHPSRRSARRAMSFRGELPGIVETRGAIELHDDGFRAAEGRLHALVLGPRRNGALIRRLAESYGAEVVRVDGPGDLDAWCRDHGLGLQPAVVDALLGPAHVEERRRARRRERRSVAVRLAATAAVLATPSAWWIADALH
jgi:hypothetical protein